MTFNVRYFFILKANTATSWHDTWCPHVWPPLVDVFILIYRVFHERHVWTENEENNLKFYTFITDYFYYKLDGNPFHRSYI